MNAAATAGRAAEAAALKAACDQVGLLATPGKIEQIQAYLDLLERWNQAYNLTAVRQRGAMLSHHVADCIAALPALNRQLPAQTNPAAQGERPRILDVGSGGGLPGVVWAIFRPDCDIVCADAVSKKTAFVQQAAGALGLAPRLSSKHGRIEAISPSANFGAFSLITSRAFASLADFTHLTAHLLAPSGVWLAMKGKPDETQAEIEALNRVGQGDGGKPNQAAVDVFHVEQLAVPGLEAQRCLVWMRPA